MPQAINYSLKEGESVTVILLNKQTGLPEFHPLHATHPTFKPLVRALKRKEWARVPKLVSTAALIADKSQGSVEVKKGGVFYKGTLVDNSLTTRILQIIKEGKPVSAMLKFMDNLYQNPESFAIGELYDWLNGCKLPITDRGTFMAYKRVNTSYKDCYTNTIDNSVGQIVFMKREDVCKDRTQTCSQGLHFCSIAYLPNYPGDKIMMVEINPKDVVSIPNDYDYSKGRTWQYEVVAEVPENQLTRLVNQKIDIKEYQTSVFSVAKDRRKLLADILALPAIKSMVRHQRKLKAKKVKRGRKAKTEKFILSERSIKKMTIGRLTALYKKFAPTEPPKPSSLTENRLYDIRVSYGFSRGQVAAKMGCSYRSVANYENAKFVPQDTVDSYLDALIRLARLGPTEKTGISFPKKTVQKSKAAAAAAYAQYDPQSASNSVEDDSVEDDSVEDGDEFGYEVEDDEVEVED
jgi:transcriptional regulator with XRE-family HTH domain